VTAESDATLDHGSSARLAFGFELRLFVLSGVLVFGELGDGPVRFDYDAADTFNWDFSDYLIFRDLAA
jgi:hypothetical protein